MSLALLQVLVTAAAAGRLAAQDPAPPRQPAVLANSVVRRDQGLAVFELRRYEQAPAPHFVELVVRPFDEASRVPMAVLWRGPWGMPIATEPLLYASIASGRWALASGADTGGGRAVELWTGHAGVLSRSGAEPDGSVERSIVVKVVLQNVVAEWAGRNAVVWHLPSPQLFVWSDEIHVVGEGQSDRRAPKDDYMLIWMAPLAELVERPPPPAPGEKALRWAPTARMVCDGVDPRIAVDEGEAILAVRAAFTLPAEEGEAPVRFYRSRDLTTWTPDLEIWQAVAARDNYAFCAVRGVLWLATTTGEGGTGLVLFRYDPSGRLRAWERRSRLEGWPIDPARDRVRSPGDRIWFLPPLDPGSSVPHLVFTGESGEFVLRRL